MGIDPHPELLRDWGLGDDVAGLERFALGAVEVLAPEVAVIKPQSAFFERHGSAGVAVLERVLAALAGTSTLSLLDVKRGDIGSTMDGYADAYLGVGAPLAADAITVSPYLGLGSLTSAIRTAEDAGRGVFVLARTSNPEGAQVQLADWAGRCVAQTVVDGVAALNADTRSGGGARGTAASFGNVGVVVGAVAAHGLDLSALNGPVLAPGLGAQGARPGDLAARFAGLNGIVLPSVSRSVLRVGPAAVRAAAAALRDELAAAG